MQGEETTGVSSASESTNISSVRPGAIPFVSHRAGAYGRLLLATYERRTARPVPCQPVIGWNRLRGEHGECLRQPMRRVLADVSWLRCTTYARAASPDSSFSGFRLAGHTTFSLLLLRSRSKLLIMAWSNRYIWVAGVHTSDVLVG